MKTTSSTLKSTNEDDLFFGNPVMCDKSSRQDFKTLVAKLFLNPQITPEHVIRYLDQLQRGIMSMDRLLKLTDNEYAVQAHLLFSNFKIVEEQYPETFAAKQVRGRCDIFTDCYAEKKRFVYLGE